jgi:hypothetical protein
MRSHCIRCSGLILFQQLPLPHPGPRVCIHKRRLRCPVQYCPRDGRIEHQILPFWLVVAVYREIKTLALVEPARCLSSQNA